LHETREKLLQTDLTERELILNLNQLEQQLSEWNQKAQQASAEQSMWQSEVSKTLEKLENFTEAAREMRKGELDKAADKLEEIASELQQDTTDLKSRQDY